jgi:hypothetical protein
MIIRFDILGGGSVPLDLEIEHDADGWWAYLPEPWTFDDNGCSAQHEDTRDELMDAICGAYVVRGKPQAAAAGGTPTETIPT